MLGAEIARHVRLADMNLDVRVSDELGIEVVANGLPLARAPDATIGCSLTFRREPPPARRRPARYRRVGRSPAQAASNVGKSSSVHGVAGLLLSALRSAAGLVPNSCNPCTFSRDTGLPLSVQLRSSVSSEC